jgi:hypothetical protein
MHAPAARTVLTWVLTAALFLSLHPDVTVLIGLTRLDNSLFVEPVDVGDPRHLLLVLAWWRALGVVLLVALYAAVLTAMLRKCSVGKRLAAGVAITCSAVMFVCILNFPELVGVTVGRGAYGPESLQGRLIRYVVGFPGGATGLAIAATVLQGTCAAAMLRFLGADTMQRERKVPSAD